MFVIVEILKRLRYAIHSSAPFLSARIDLKKYVEEDDADEDEDKGIKIDLHCQRRGRRIRDLKDVSVTKRGSNIQIINMTIALCG